MGSSNGSSGFGNGSSSDSKSGEEDSWVRYGREAGDKSVICFLSFERKRKERENEFTPCEEDVGEGDEF
jgi:hypothetical protein